MKTNLEKWNYYLGIINTKTNEFINSQIEGKTIPTIYYVVTPFGNIVERAIVNIEYYHNGKTYFNGKKPTNKNVDEISEYSSKHIHYSCDNIYLKYSEIWDIGNNLKSISTVKFNDIINEIGLYYSISDAEIASKKILDKNRIDKEFNDQHKKDSKYNYVANGYKFLGWQNGWKYDYYDEDGNLCSETGKQQKSYSYSKENYPEYRKCLDSKHRRINVSHNSRGSENTVSCPICMIYWKYDCSD